MSDVIGAASAEPAQARREARVKQPAARAVNLMRAISFAARTLERPRGCTRRATPRSPRAIERRRIAPGAPARDSRRRCTNRPRAARLTRRDRPRGPGLLGHVSLPDRAIRTGDRVAEAGAGGADLDEPEGAVAVR